jgi:uncharacterized membrane protein
MSTPAIETTRPIRPARPWIIVATLCMLAAGALWFIEQAARQYSVYDAVNYGDLWPRRGGLIPHMAGGLVAISTGLIQLWLGVTQRTGSLHRNLGRVYLGGVAVGSAGAFYLALTIESRYFAYAAGLFMLGTAWVLTTSMAYAAIRRRAIERHREWMIRSYTVTFAFVLFRLADQLLTHWHFAPVDQIDAMTAWACWSVPLLLVEPLLQFRKARRGALH